MPHAAASRCTVWVPSRPIRGRPPRSCTRWTARALCLIASERTARSRGFGPHDSWPHARHPSKASGDAPSLRLAPRKALAMRVFDTTLYQIYPLGMLGCPFDAPALDDEEAEAPSPSARGEWAEKDYLPMRPFTMVREILPRALSTPVIHTVTVSPTATTSLGCFTKRSASLEMWTRPS